MPNKLEAFEATNDATTYGTGSPLTAEEIAAAAAAPTCETCGIIHVGRECRPQTRYDEPRGATRGREIIR